MIQTSSTIIQNKRCDPELSQLFREFYETVSSHSPDLMTGWICGGEGERFQENSRVPGLHHWVDGIVLLMDIGSLKEGVGRGKRERMCPSV